MHGARRVAHLRPCVDPEADVPLFQRLGRDAEEPGDPDAGPVDAEQKAELLEPALAGVEQGLAHLGAFHIAQSSATRLEADLMRDLEAERAVEREVLRVRRLEDGHRRPPRRPRPSPA